MLAWFDAAQGYAKDAQREREDLDDYATATLVWLERESPSGGPGETSFGLVTPEERLRTWALCVETEAAQRLPERPNCWPQSDGASCGAM
jgi:hypothetical protein